jgi:hypothetical protein
MNILTDHRRSRRTDLPCRSALVRPSPVCGTPRSETLHATRSQLSDHYHIALRRRTARILLNCLDLHLFPFACLKTDSHITSRSAAQPYGAVPSNQKNVLRFRSTSFAPLQLRNLRSSRPEPTVKMSHFPMQPFDITNLNLFSLEPDRMQPRRVIADFGILSIFDFQVVGKIGHEQSDSPDLISRHDENTIRHNIFFALFARIGCPPPTCNRKVHFPAFFKNTITLRPVLGRPALKARRETRDHSRTVRPAPQFPGRDSESSPNHNFGRSARRVRFRRCRSSRPAREISLAPPVIG